MTTNDAREAVLALLSDHRIGSNESLADSLLDLFDDWRASERAKVEALLEAAESTIAAADESRAQARAQWEAQMTTGFPCRTCGAPARHWEHGMSGNWNSQPASYPACNDHATFYHFYSADLSGIRAAIDAVRAWRAS